MPKSTQEGPFRRSIKRPRPQSLTEEKLKHKILAPIVLDEAKAPSSQHRKARAATLANKGDPYAVIHMLHGEHDYPIGITGWATAENTLKRNRRQSCKLPFQNKYKVQWSSSIVPDWELPYYARTRYAPIQAIPLREDDSAWEEYVLCEH
jgi:hypothetical protein